jgi:hypothetical protein
MATPSMLYRSVSTGFRQKSAAFPRDAIAGESGLLDEMLEYLNAWLTSHIAESDVQFKHFLILTVSWHPL